MKYNTWIPIGILFIVLGITLNQWVIAALIIPEGVIKWNALEIAIWSLEIFTILVGVIIIRYRSTHLPKSLIVSTVSLIAVFLLIEFFFRAYSRIFPTARPDFKRAQVLYEFQRSTQYHPDWGWSFMPDADVVWEEEWMGREKTRINPDFKTLPIPGYPRFGMRDDGLNEYTGTVIPIFGDSFTFGSTVELGEIWTELIEQRNSDVDMLNLASGGGLAKAVEQYRVLRDLLPPHDYVIYAMWLGNEFFDNYAFSQVQVSYDELRRAHISETQKRRLQAGSYLAYVVVEAIDNIKKSLNSRNTLMTYANETNQLWDDKYGNFYLYPINPILLRYTEPSFADERIIIGIQKTEVALVRMNSLAEDRELVIILFPFKEQLHEDIVQAHRPELDITKPNRIVMDLCKRYDINCIDLLPMLEKYEAEKLFWDYDVHFTKAGQFYASLEIETILKQHDIIRTE
jgi:hypothetical protein